MRINFLTNTGSSLLQVMLLTAALGGAGVYLLKGNQDQNKLLRTTGSKRLQSVLHREFSEAFSDGSVCLKTLDAGVQNPLLEDLDLSFVADADGQVMYSKLVGPARQVYGWTIESMKLDLPETYVATDPMKLWPAELVVMAREQETRSDMKSFGGRDFATRIPLFLVTYQKKILRCLSDDSGSVIEAMKLTCEELGGVFNEDSATCENLQGNLGHVKKLIDEHFCSLSPSGCSTHPYAGRVCQDQADPRGQSHGNWVIKEFAGNGDFICECVPLKVCENKDDHCLGVDLGTDGCSQDCGYGTKTTGACLVCNASAWSPEASTICSGVSFTQTNECGDTRDELGSKSCASSGPWTAGAWGACSESCGGGTQTRSVSCSFDSCTGARPSESQACNTQSCTCFFEGLGGNQDGGGACSSNPAPCDFECNSSNIGRECLDISGSYGGDTCIIEQLQCQCS